MSFGISTIHPNMQCDCYGKPDNLHIGANNTDVWRIKNKYDNNGELVLPNFTFPNITS